jgi:hypothetical protein
MAMSVVSTRGLRSESRPRVAARRRRWVPVLVVALPLGFFSLAVGLLSLLPALVRTGALRGTIERAASEAVGAAVTVREADVPEHDLLVLRGVEVGQITPGVGPAKAAEVRIRFGWVFPLGGAGSVEVERPRLSLGITADTFRAGPGKASGGEVPTIRVVHGSAEGTLEGLPFRVADLEARLDGDRLEAVLRGVESTLPGDLRVRMEELALGAGWPDRRLSGRADFEKLSFARGDLEGGNIRGRLGIDLALQAQGYEGRLGLSLAQAEILKGDIYQDLQGQPLELSITGRLNTAGRVCDFDDVRLSLGRLGALEARGRVEDSSNGLAYRLKVASTEIPLEELTGRLAEVVPGLAGRGHARVDLVLEGDAARSLASARMFLRDADLSLGRASVLDLAGEIPVLVTRGDAGRALAPENGRLAWTDLKVAGASTGPQALGLVAEANVLRSTGRLSFPLWGGEARWGSLEVRTPASGVQVETSLVLAALDLGRATAGLGMKRPVEGKLEGAFPRVRVTADRIAFEGEARARVWDGEIDLREIAVVEPFNPLLTAYRVAFDAREVHLQDICRQASEFGLATGRLFGRGWVEIFRNGMPQEMDVDVWADPYRGGSLDLKAVRSLAIIVEGSEKTARQIESLPCNELRYERFGFHARVSRRGALTLRGRYYRPRGGLELLEYTADELRRGVVREGALEYVMAGTGLLRMNIFNSPGTLADFREVVSRVFGLRGNPGGGSVVK